MSDPAALVADARAFLGALARNNSRDWFQAHRADYDAKLKEPAQRLLADLAERLGRTTGEPMTTKLFRIHRDVRFSKDKTPYNTHLHMLWQQSSHRDGPGWFYGIGLDYLRTGWGWMSFTPAQLSTWRDAVDGPYGAGIDAAIAACGMEIGGPELKRVPAPHAKDHPLAEHLRRKSLVLWSDPPDGAAGSLMAEFARIEPLRKALSGLL
ncbi:MAG: TIGR02453 family protein [Rhodobacter sp.]|nr:TIGR02453 family protein [Rhodobacter sp.]